MTYSDRLFQARNTICGTALSWALSLALLNPSLSLAQDSTEVAKLGAKVKEVFRSRCFECHGGSAVQGGVDVLKVAELRDQEYATPGKPDDSLLYEILLEEDEDARMPLGQPPLDPNEISLIRKWIVAGAKDFPSDVVEAEADPTVMETYRDPDYLFQQILEHQP